ncbi:MAG: PA0069 family radical SAM protein [Tepidisphaeraceae bacterium]
MGVSLPVHGRGTGSNPTNRFETLHVEPDFDHGIPPEERPAPKTQFLLDSSRSLLVRNTSPDIPFEMSINPYRGCEHGCAYCFARPFHEYLGMSAGIDFETRIFVKRDAAAVLRKELLKPSYRPQRIAMSGVTDIYQPAERTFQITRQCLEVLAEFRNPVGLITKNHLVTRDLDLLKRLAAFDGVRVHLSVTTLDNALSSKLEPRASSPSRRLAAIRTLAEAGIRVGVMVAPVIPGLTDHEVPAILKAVKDAGAQTAGCIVLRLPGNVQPIFVEWLRQHCPDRADRVLNRLREMRGGKLNDGNFFSRFNPGGEFAGQIQSLFDLHARKLGLDEKKPPLNTDAFRRPGGQLSLF